MRRPRSALVCVLTISCVVQRRADQPATRPLPDGVSLQAGAEQVELRVVSPHAFCLSVHDPAATRPADSIYLGGEARSGTSFQVVQEGEATGIATDFGQLMVDPQRAMWSLRDAAGRVLADWTALGKPAPGQAPPSAAFQLSVGPGATPPHPLFYGSGSHPNRGALAQESGQANTGNGTAMLPQYWSTAGYGVLLVGSKDNAPGSWLTEGGQSVPVTAKLDEVPAYVRAGTLLPLGPVVQFTGQATTEPLEMQIYGGRDATFDLVEDDGETRAYQQGAARTTHFAWEEQTQTLTWKATGDDQGERVFPTVKAVLFSPRGQTEKQAPPGGDGALNFH